MNNTHGVFNRDKLFSRLLFVDLGSPKAGKNNGLFSGDEVAAVEFGRNLYTKLTFFHGLGSVFGIWGRADEVASHRQK